MGGGGKSAAKRQATQARADEVARQDQIRRGTSAINDTFGQFNDDFFGNLRNSFTNYARPQLDKQFGDARDQLTFNLARSGTLDSSMRGTQNADLQERYDTNLQDITDQGRAYEAEARTNVERQRANLLTTLQSTADATGASNSAMAQAAALATPPSYSPLGQLFQDGTSMLGQQAALERSYAMGYGPRPRYNTGLFGTSNNAVKTS